ncbi:MAG TPA: 23S rRNA (uracil(1939)-C(5))-methyltransferase RlmD [Elusimicrobiota bacterium]|nr:23S rRNA (uracil(1939)-C(5))-methyltransferase RlmD [Elusimicrobiota bacterium]
MKDRGHPSRSPSERPPSASTTVDVTIERLSLGGEGVAHVEGMVVFVPYTAPGDRVQVELVERHARYARGRLLHVLSPSKARVEPPCPYHFQLRKEERPASGPFISHSACRIPHFCGGCSWQHLRYEEQLAAKREILRETLERVGGLRGLDVRALLGMAEPWRYRNKVQVPVGWDGHRMISGFFEPGSHRIVPIDDCLVQPSLSVAIVNRARAWLAQQRAPAYDAAAHRGWIRHLLVRTAGGKTPSEPDQALLTIVTRTPEFPRERDFVESLAREFPPLAGIHHNVNPSRTNAILGRRWRRLGGAPTIEERVGRLRFRLSPGSFFQVNTPQAHALYETVRQCAGSGPRLLDLYCGVGGIALYLADRFGEVGGVEEYPAAIEDADANARLNGISNVRFMAAPVETFLGGWQRRDSQGLTVVLDPPRAGCTPPVLKALVRLAPPRLVYVSCDPGTLARDLACFAQGGYEIETVQPVDLFPHTPHIETVVRLRQQRV